MGRKPTWCPVVESRIVPPTITTVPNRMAGVTCSPSSSTARPARDERVQVDHGRRHRGPDLLDGHEPEEPPGQGAHDAGGRESRRCPVMPTDCSESVSATTGQRAMVPTARLIQTPVYGLAPRSPRRMRIVAPALQTAPARARAYTVGGMEALERDATGVAPSRPPRRPLPRPLERHVAIATCVASVGRPHLDEVLDLEAAPAEQPHPVAVGEVELDARVVRATRPGASRRPGGAGGRRRGRRSRRGTQRVRRAELLRKIRRPPGRSRRAASGTQRYGIGPQARAVLGDGEVEARVGIRHRLGVAVQEGEVEAVLALESARRGQLRGGVVDPDHPRAAPGEPGRHVGRAAAQLDGVLAGEVVAGARRASDSGTPPDAPRRFGPRPGSRAAGRVVRGLGVPEGAVAAHVLGQLSVVGHGFEGAVRAVVALTEATGQRMAAGATVDRMGAWSDRSAQLWRYQ